ncbi:MAG TPA: DUF4437 domain-containing protein [Candidatus Sulfotelmatobacter sp.]|nr:DUF4437 domain-containing protein [Candidatus Sulfotelmatobacter sp.]
MRAVAALLVLIASAASLRSPGRTPQMAAASNGLIVANLNSAKWEPEGGGSGGAESATLREDPITGGVEVYARYPAGTVFPPHWHSANERMVLLEGRISIRDGAAEKFLDPGGYAFMPAKQIQNISCISKTNCTFYVYWDGKLDFHKAGEN